MGILEVILTLLLLIALPLGELYPLAFGSIRITWLDSAVLVLLLMYFIFFMTKKKTLPLISKPFGIFSGFALFSLLLAFPSLSINQWIASSLYFVRWIGYFLIIFPLITCSEKFKKQIPLLFYISSLLILLVGYVQYFLFPSLRGLTYEGWDPHLYRMFGSFFDPNFLGSYLVVSFLLGLQLFLQQKEKHKKHFYTVGNTLLLIGIFLTFSRSSYIALFIGVSVFTFLKGYKKWLLCILASLILFGGVIFGLSFRQNEGTNLLRTASTAARIGNMQRAMSIITDSPLIGVGFNTYRYAQHKKGFLGGIGWEISHSGAGVNNSYLFVMATTGIIGLIAFLYLLYSLFRIGRQTKSPYGIIFIAALVAIGINSLFENTFFYEAILLWMWMMAGVIENT